MFITTQMQKELALTSFPAMLHNGSGLYLQLFLCNSFQIFIFHCMYFLIADVFFLAAQWLASFTKFHQIQYKKT